jgi:hypothetical protein
MGSGPGTSGGGGGGGGGGGTLEDVPPDDVTPDLEDLVLENIAPDEVLPTPGSLHDAMTLAAQFGITVKVANTPEDVDRIGKGDSDWLGLYFPGTDEIVINGVQFPDAATTAKKMESMGKTRWLSSGTASHVFHHEIGHARHYRNIGGAQWTNLRKRRSGKQAGKYRTGLTKKLRKAIGKEVSSYTTTNRYEIVAEMYAGMRSGKSYSPRLMKYYNALGGPKA